jgi:hypothetical protein
MFGIGFSSDGSNMSNKPTSNARGGPLAAPSRRPARRISLRSLTVCGALAASLLVSLSSSAGASTSSIVDRLSADKHTVEVVSLPVGTNLIKVAVMKNLAGEGLTYKTIPATELRYAPPAGYPVVDLQAATSKGAPVGNWAGRLQTVPGVGETQAEREARERAEREARERKEHEERERTEREARERAEREARERTEREARERTEREAREREEREHAAHMVVGLDAGGWAWESAIRDFSGAVKDVRASYTYYNSDSQIGLLARYGVQLLPLFNEWSAGHVLAWCQRYCHGGSYWAGKTDLGATTIEVVNEPGNPYFWGSGAQSDQARYAATVEEYARVLSALPAANRPRLLVSYDGGFEGDNYGRALIRTDPHLLQLPIDWTVHPYGGHGSQSANGNRSRVTEAYADTKQPVFVTEVGWPTDTAAGPTGDSLQWTESQQASNIAGFYEWARSLKYVAGVVYFNYADYGPNNWYGIVNSSGTKHKAAYATLQRLATEG